MNRSLLGMLPRPTCHLCPVHLSSHLKKCCFPRAGSPFCRALLSFYGNPPASPLPHPRVGGTTSPGLSLNRSQYGGCSTKYNTPAGTQVGFPRVHNSHNSSQSNSLTPAVCPGVLVLQEQLMRLLSQRATLTCTLLTLPNTRSGPSTYRCIVTRRNSDLEAFSHNPTDGSFVAPHEPAVPLVLSRTCIATTSSTA
jgi:hypothetical protein